MTPTRAKLVTPASNPFSTRFVRPGVRRYRFTASESDEGSKARLRQLAGQLTQRRVGLIVGPHGSGKSTLLSALSIVLREQFCEICHLQFQSPQRSAVTARFGHPWRNCFDLLRRQTKLSDGGLLVIDGVEQLSVLGSLLVRLAAWRRSQAILATGHVPLVGFPLLYRTSVSGDLVRRLTDELLSESTPEIRSLIDGEMDRQDWSKLTSVRDLWFECYEAVQNHRAEAESPKGNRISWPSACPSS